MPGGRVKLFCDGDVSARAYQIHGQGLSANNIGNLSAVSGIEPEATTRLVELWHEQHFDYWRLRIGEQSITTEFLSPDQAACSSIAGSVGRPCR
jgi:porin